MDVSITIHTQNPAGTMLDFAGSTVPFGYIACDGSTVSRVTYARLFEIIGTSFGAGDGSTTFKLPDFRGRVAVGSGQGSSLTNRTLAQTGGAETHALSEAELASHTHIQNSHNHSQNAHSHNVYGSNATGATAVNIGQSSSTGLMGTSTATGGSLGYFTNTGTAAGVHQIISDTTATNNPFTATNQNTGGGQAHNNMQPFLVCTKIIKF